MSNKTIEQKALIGGIFVNILMCIAGITIYEITHIEALFIDAYFSVITLGTGVLSLIISKITARQNAIFPNGLFALEPLYSLFQSLLTIILLIFSLVKVYLKAYKYFMYNQGILMNIKPIIPYELIMLILSLSLSYYYYWNNKKINQVSTMLFSETKGTLTDGLMSLGIGLFAFILLFIKQNSPLAFLRYTGDFFITSLLVLLAIRLPIQIIKRSFIELCGGLTLDFHMKQWIETCLKKYCFKDLIIKKYFVYKVGMSFRIYVFISSKEIYIDNKSALRIKKLILKELSSKISFVHLDFCLC